MHLNKVNVGCYLAIERSGNWQICLYPKYALNDITFEAILV